MSIVVGIVVLSAGVLSVGVLFVGLLYDQIIGFKSPFFCRKLGWHDGNGRGAKFFDGCSVHSTCSRCGKEVMRDGQGNWF